MIAGLNQYQNGRGGHRSDYSRSSIVDRMLTLNLKVCIPMYMMADVPKLMENYENQLNKTTSAASQGIHLIGTNQSNALSDENNNLDKSWRRLPCPIPPVEMADIMSPMQKTNQDYLEARFKEAVNNGIISFNGEGGVAPYEPGDPNGTFDQEVFEVHDFSLDGAYGVVNTMMLEDIKSAIDEVVKDVSISAEKRLDKLRNMRSGAPVRIIHYGKYMRNYANALRIPVIKPLPTDDRSVRSVAAQNYINTRYKLCAYMLGLYPRCLDIVEKEFRIFEYLHKSEKILEEEIDRKFSIYRKADEYLMLFITNVITTKLNWFGLVYKEDFKRLFQHDNDVMPLAMMSKYPELAFIKQLEGNMDKISEGLQDQIAMEQQAYPADALSLLEMKLKDQVEPQVIAKVGTWEKTLESIRDNMDLNRADKEEMVNFYTRLLKNAKDIRDAFAMA